METSSLILIIIVFNNKCPLKLSIKYRDLKKCSKIMNFILRLVKTNSTAMLITLKTYGWANNKKKFSFISQHGLQKDQYSFYIDVSI